MQAKEGVHTLDLKHSMSDTTPAELIPLVKFGFEGIIAKPQSSCYEPAKRSASLKYKVKNAQEFVIGGYTPDNPLDALIVGYTKAIS
jgi:ATP-dependent DNA ligase